MGGLIPLGDASRRPSRFPAVTVLIILANVFVFILELAGGNRFVHTWSAIPAKIVFGLLGGLVVTLIWVGDLVHPLRDCGFIGDVGDRQRHPPARCGLPAHRPLPG